MTNNFLDDIEFATANYELNEIRTRLDESEKKGEAEKERRKNMTASSDSLNKKHSTPAIEHAVIFEWAKNGRWQTTPCTLKPGADNFCSDLDHVLKTRKPDQIRVMIYEGKKAKKAIFDKKITIINTHEKANETALSGLEGLKKKFENGDANNFSIQILRLELLMENEKTKHDSEVRELNMSNQFEIRRLQDKIQELTSTIAEYEDDDEDLNGTDEKEGKDFSMLTELGGNLLSSAGEYFFKKNPAFLKGLGMPEEVINKFLSGKKQLEAGTNSTTEASFSEAGATEFDVTGLTDEHSKGLKNLFDVCHDLSASDFEIIFNLFCEVYDNKKQELKHELITQLMDLI